MREGTYARLVLLLAALAACHADSATTDDPVPLVKVAPASVSSVGAWSLFDRSTSSSFVPGPDLVRVMLDHVEQVSAIKVFGSAPYHLRVSGMAGTSIGFSSIDLSSLGSGWHFFPTTSLVATNVVELQFEGTGAAGKIPELEIWAVDDETETPRVVDVTAAELPENFVTLWPGTRSAELTPSECATFDFNITRAPAALSGVHLVYTAEGVLRGFSLRRTVNGVAEQGGAWLAGDATARTVVDELDPSTLHLGANEVGLCVPNDATRGVALSNVHLVAEPDRGVDLAAAISIGERARDCQEAGVLTA